MLFSAGLHWITFAPAIFFLGIAGAVQAWGTRGLVGRLGLEALPEQVAALIGLDLDSALTMVATLLAVAMVGTGLARVLSTRLAVTANGVRWERRGLRAHEVTARFETIESVDVEQGFLGRLLGYGTVNVLGRNAIGRRRRIAQPAAFRKVFNDQMSKWLCRDLGTDPRGKRAMTG